MNALAPVMSPEAIQAREAAEWNGRYHYYDDAILAVGDRIEDQVPFTLPTGDTLSYRMVTMIAGRDSCAGETCARIQVAYDSDLGAANKLVSEMSSKLFHALDADSIAPSSSGTRVSGTCDRLVHPGTLQIHSETAKRVMWMTIRMAGHDPVDAVMTETRTYA